MNTPYPFEDMVPERMVYIKPVAVSDLPDDVQSQLPALDEIYALHGPDGERLALVADRAQAVALARDNDLSVLTLH